MFNKQTTPINATFPAKVPCKVKTTAQTYIWFSNSDWIILALGNCEDPQKITKKICSFDSLAGTNKRTPLPASFRFWWRTQLNPMNAYQTRKYLRLFDVLLACTLWDFQNRIVIGHVFVYQQETESHVNPWVKLTEGKSRKHFRSLVLAPELITKIFRLCVVTCRVVSSRVVRFKVPMK